MSEDAQPGKINIKGSNFEAGGNIHVGDIAVSINFIGSLVGFSKEKIVQILDEYQKQIDLHEDKRLASIKEKNLSHLEQALSLVLDSTASNERQVLLSIMAQWTKPILEKYQSYREFHFPFGSFCLDLITNMVESNDAIKRSKSITSVSDLTKIVFTSRSVIEDGSSLLQDTSISPQGAKTVYLELISKIFPIRTVTEKPFGFYLQYLPLGTNRKNDLRILLVTNNEFNNWKSILNDEVDKSYQPYDINGNLTDDARSSNSWLLSHNEYMIYEMKFNNQQIEFISIEPRLKEKYTFEITFEHFSTFIIGFIGDYLLLGSRSLFNEESFEKRKLELFQLLHPDIGNSE